MFMFNQLQWVEDTETTRVFMISARRYTNIKKYLKSRHNLTQCLNINNTKYYK